MKKIKTYIELSEFVGSIITNGFADIRKQYVEFVGYEYKQSSYSNMRVVIVGGGGEIRCCSRENKKEGETEIILLRKTDLLSKGLTPNQWDKVMEKCSLWLERNGYYKPQKRFAIKSQQALFPKE